MPEIIDHEKLSRKQINEIALEEGFSDPGDTRVYRTKAELAQAIMAARAGRTREEETEEFEPRTYWAIGPLPVYPAPNVQNIALGRGRVIRSERGKYVARTAFEDKLIRENIVALGHAFPEDPESQWDDEAYCPLCNYRPRSMKAWTRHHKACHPIGY